MNDKFTNPSREKIIVPAIINLKEHIKVKYSIESYKLEFINII